MDKYSLAFKDKLVGNVATVEGCKFLQLSLEPGQGLTKQYTPYTFNLIVLSGHIRYSIEDVSEEHVFGVTDVITLEPKREHAVEAIEKSIVLLILIPKASE